MVAAGFGQSGEIAACLEQSGMVAAMMVEYSDVANSVVDAVSSLPPRTSSNATTPKAYPAFTLLPIHARAGACPGVSLCKIHIRKTFRA